MNDLFKKTLTFVLIITFVFSTVFAVPARAQWIDISTAAKDYGLDALAWEIVNRIISRMSASTVKWINTGFNGKPAYVTDPTAYFGSIADGIAGQYIMNNPNLDLLCGPIRSKIRIALSKTYNNRDNTRWQCTLTEVGRNMEDFMNDFENGGWDSFFQISQNRHMNPLGAYLQAEGELFDKIAEKTAEKDKELSWGSGFMSQKECVETAPAIEIPTYDTKGKVIATHLIPGPCLKERTVTPGETISNQLNKQLGLGNDKLAVADEINEIISGLLNQLVSRVIGGVAGGLRGASEPDVTNNNLILTDELSSECLDQSTDPTNLDTYVPSVDPKNCVHVRKTKDYFGNVNDTSILDTPLPTATPTATLPLDRDCSGMDINTLNTMAQNEANRTGTTFEDALQNLDCPPAGIN